MQPPHSPLASGQHCMQALTRSSAVCPVPLGLVCVLAVQNFLYVASEQNSCCLEESRQRPHGLHSQPGSCQRSGSGRQGLLCSSREGGVSWRKAPELKEGGTPCTVILASQENGSSCLLPPVPGSPRALHTLSSFQEMLFGGSGREKKLKSYRVQRRCLVSTLLSPWEAECGAIHTCLTFSHQWGSSHRLFCIL